MFNLKKLFDLNKFLIGSKILFFNQILFHSNKSNFQTIESLSNNFLRFNQIFFMSVATDLGWFNKIAWLPWRKKFGFDQSKLGLQTSFKFIRIEVSNWTRMNQTKSYRFVIDLYRTRFETCFGLNKNLVGSAK